MKSQPYFEFVTTRSCELYDIFCLVVVNRPCFCITLCCCLYANECCRLSRKYVRVCLSDCLSVTILCVSSVDCSLDFWRENYANELSRV